MRNFIKAISIIFVVALNNGCSSDDAKKIANTITDSNSASQQTDDYNSEKYRPYGLFFGELASDGESSDSIMLIDDTSKTYFFWVAGLISSGTYKTSGGRNFTSENTAVYSLDDNSLLKSLYTKDDEDKNIILKYTFKEIDTLSWGISYDGADTSVTFPEEPALASSISRGAPIPARNDIIANQYLIQHRGVIFPAYNMTIDFSDNGNISGIDSDGCVYNGSFSPGNQNFNIYQVELDVNNCDLRGNYDGLAAVGGISDSVATSIVVMVKSNTGALMFTASTN